MKPKTVSALAALVQEMHKEMDPSAQTIEELLIAAGRTVTGATRQAMARMLREAMEAGTVERVHKVYNGKTIPAYRDKR